MGGVRDKNVLDIGCAYGGYTIESRRRGATVAYGVDVNPQFIAFAEANLNDDGEDIRSGCKFLCCDMTSEKSSVLPKNYFNMLLVNDVFEHVYDTTRLMQIIDRVSAADCTLYFQIPNGLHFFDFVEREPHYFEYGQSFLEPGYCSYKDVFYRRWEYYAALFKYFGFGKVQMMNPVYSGSINDCRQEVMAKFNHTEKELKEKFNDNTDMANLILHKLQDMKSEMIFDLSEMNTEALDFKYLTGFWTGVAVKCVS